MPQARVVLLNMPVTWFRGITELPVTSHTGTVTVTVASNLTSDGVTQWHSLKPGPPESIHSESESKLEFTMISLQIRPRLRPAMPRPSLTVKFFPELNVTSRPARRWPGPGPCRGQPEAARGRRASAAVRTTSRTLVPRA